VRHNFLWKAFKRLSDDDKHAYIQDDTSEEALFSVRRAVELDINAPLADVSASAFRIACVGVDNVDGGQVADAWWRQGDRHHWDNTNMVDSKLLHEMDEKTRVWAYTGTPGFDARNNAVETDCGFTVPVAAVPARPHLASSPISVIGREVPASLFRHTHTQAGTEPPEARAFVQLFNDKFEDIQAPWNHSRFNSLMVMVGDEPEKTRCIYVAELGTANNATPREVTNCCTTICYRRC